MVKGIIRFFIRMALSSLMRKVDSLSDVQIDRLAEEVDKRVDIPFVGPSREKALIRTAVRRSVMVVHEFATLIDREGL